MSREIILGPPKKEPKSIDVGGDLSPSADGALDAERVCIRPYQPPGKSLVEGEKLLPLRVLPLMGAGAFLLHAPLLSRALKAKGRLLPFIRKL